jgi:hypothetical protein
MTSIQKNIPMPVTKPRGKNGRRTEIYPWRQMQVGDSFLFPERIGRGAYAAAKARSNSGAEKFEVRKTEAGFRCWRVQ